MASDVLLLVFLSTDHSFIQSTGQQISKERFTATISAARRSDDDPQLAFRAQFRVLMSTKRSYAYKESMALPRELPGAVRPHFKANYLNKFGCVLSKLACLLA